MPAQTPVYGFPFEVPSDQPGISLTGGEAGLSPILAEEVEEELIRIDNVLASPPVQRIVFTTSGSFDKGSFPNLRAVDIEVVGGGGAGGGASSPTFPDASSGGGGGAGGYSKKLIVVSALLDNETVTVGGGGTGVLQGTGNAGESSSFGTHLSATGGLGAGVRGNSENAHGASGAPGGMGSNGDINTPGSPGGASLQSNAVAIGGNGGDSFFSGGARGEATVSSGTGGSGNNAVGFGGGGSGGRNRGTIAAPRSGGDGAPGVVIVTLYY